MQSYFAACGLSLVLAAALTKLVRDVACRFGLVDPVSSSRKIHAAPVPRLGGLGILGGVAGSVLAFGYLTAGPTSPFASDAGLQIGVLGCSLGMAALGIYDDLRGADARVKFCVQFLIATVVYLCGLRISAIANPFGPTIPLGSLAFPFTLLWIVGVVNAVNLIDGLDGLAGGVALVAVATELLLASSAGDPAMCLLLVALGGAVLGFLIFNFNPASIFMGDSGSMLIGFILAVAPLRAASQGDAAVPLLVPILGLGLPIADTLLAMIRRSLSGRPMFSADKEHIHHRVLRRVGGNQRKAVVVLYAACSGFAAAGAVLAFLNGASADALFAGVAVAALYLFYRLGCFGFDTDLRVLRQRNRRLRELGMALRKQLAACRSSAEVGATLEPVAAWLGCTFDVSLDEEGGGNQRLTFRPGPSSSDAGGVSWECGVLVAGRQVGRLRATWFDGRAEPDRDEERFLENLLVHIARALARQRTVWPARVALQR